MTLLGWEPVTEMEPHMDENLIAALQKLGDNADLVTFWIILKYLRPISTIYYSFDII